MVRFAVARILGLLLTLLLIVTFAFFIIRLAPGSPFDDERSVTPAVRANLEAAYGLDAPLGVQYARYVGALLEGDFGPSLKHRDTTVNEMLAQGLPVSLQIGVLALALAIAAGIPLGLWAALRSGRLADHLTSVYVALAIAIPAFVLGPLLAMGFGLGLGWLPVSGWARGDPRYLVLPVVTLAVPVVAYVARLTRAGLLDVLVQPHVRAARARGLGNRRVVLFHALRPALQPVIQYLGPAAAFVLTGSLVVETVFGIPGAGRYLVEGALNRDYTLVMGMIVVYATLTLLANLAADLVNAWLDPRAHRS